MQIISEIAEIIASAADGGLVLYFIRQSQVLHLNDHCH